MNDNKTEMTLPRTEAFVWAEKIVNSLYKHMGQQIELIYAADTTVLTDYYVVCRGRSATHMQALAADLDGDMSEAGFPAKRIEGKNGGEWILVDFGSVIVHIFSREGMEFYRFDRLFPADKTFAYTEEMLSGAAKADGEKEEK